MSEVHETWISCTNCTLAESRNNVVLGEGPHNASIMIVGEAPGEEEDKEGKPFVGESGKLLNKLLEYIDLPRDDVFITNVVCCRPPENVDPTKDQLQACWSRLKSQIYLVDPDVLVAMGKVAAQHILGVRGFKITRERGIGRTIAFEGIGRPYPLFVMPAVHMAYLLRNPSRRKDGPIGRTAGDLEMVQKIVGRLRDLRGEPR